MLPWILILGKEPKFQRNRTGAIQEIAHPENWGRSQIISLSPQGPYPTDSMWLWYARARDTDLANILKISRRHHPKHFRLDVYQNLNAYSALKSGVKLNQRDSQQYPGL